MRKLTALMLAFLLITVGASCSRGSSVARSKWNLSSAKSFTREITFNDTGRSLKQVTLELDLNLTGGKVAWEAFDPSGKLIISSSTQSKYRDKFKLDAVPGQWRLVVTATDAVGSMEFLWRGRK